MELNSPVKDILKYTYGILTNDGKTYYIFIDNIVTDQHGKSYISFSVDWWATEWFNIHPSIAHIKHSSYKPLYMPQPFQPLKTDYSSIPLDSSRLGKGCYMFTYIPSNEGEDSYISLGVMDITDNTTAMIQNGYWYQNLKLAGSDIKDCFVVPLISTDDFNIEGNSKNCIFISELSTQSGTLDNKILWSLQADYPHCYNQNHLFSDYIPTWHYNDPGTPPDDFGTAIYDVRNNHFYRVYIQERYTPTTIPPYYILELYLVVFDETIDFSKYGYSVTYTYEELNSNDRWELMPFILTNNDNTIESISFNISNLDISSTEQKVMGINDWNGDLIWECPYGMSVTSFKVRVLTGISHVMLEFLPNGIDKSGYKLTGLGFSYDCRHPGLFLDSYKEYVLKNRDYDIAMRQIQSDKQLWTAGSSTAENIGFGIAFGGPKGGTAAGVGGLIETFSTYVINKEFDPKIQEQYDRRYQRMTDQISLVGDSITNVYNEKNNGLLQIYSLEMDLPSKQRMANYINVNGYVCDEFTDNLQSLFDVDVKIQADNIIVEGATCLEAKHQTVYRLQNGVEFL